MNLRFFCKADVRSTDYIAALRSSFIIVARIPPKSKSLRKNKTISPITPFNLNQRGFERQKRNAVAFHGRHCKIDLSGVYGIKIVKFN